MKCTTTSVRTVRTDRPYGRSVRTVRTDRPYGPSVRTVRTDRPYEPSVRTFLRTVRTDRPYGRFCFLFCFCQEGSTVVFLFCSVLADRVCVLFCGLGIAAF